MSDNTSAVWTYLRFFLHHFLARGRIGNSGKVGRGMNRNLLRRGEVGAAEPVPSHTFVFDDTPATSEVEAGTSSGRREVEVVMMGETEVVEPLDTGRAGTTIPG